MVSFASDYIAGAHPTVLKKLCDTNLQNLSGYGSDIYCKSAAEKIKTAFDCKCGQVFFLVGGTQTNQVVISTLLDCHEGVIAAKTGHISLHEAGAIECGGHKVIELESVDGKISAFDLKNYLEGFYADENRDFFAYPGMVYVSFPTEYGTLYTKKELSDIYDICKQYGLPLYIDGARLGYGLMSRECDIKPQELPRLCDVFYIGGTKVGALCGEAVVFTHNNMPTHFSPKVKQRGALLSKGRLLGVQFDALFSDNLYFEISRHAIDMAERVKSVFKERGFKLLLNSPTNQQFVILDNSIFDTLRKEVDFGFWEKFDSEHSVVRFATSWSTTEADITALITALDKINE